jgi:hypothetical protein
LTHRDGKERKTISYTARIPDPNQIVQLTLLIVTPYPESPTISTDSHTLPSATLTIQEKANHRTFAGEQFWCRIRRGAFVLPMTQMEETVKLTTVLGGVEMVRVAPLGQCTNGQVY